MDKEFYTFQAFHDRPSDTLSMSLPYASYSSFDTISPQFSQGSPYHDFEFLSGDSKKIRKKRNTYQKIDDETRRQLLEAVQQGDTLKAAARRFNINYSSAKSILHTFRKEGRITKKSAQERMCRRTKIPNPSEMSPVDLLKQSQGNLDEIHDGSTHYSFEENSPRCGQSEDGSPRRLTSNSFGGLLKTEFQNSQEAENFCLKPSASSAVPKSGLRQQPSINVETNSVKPQVYNYSEEPYNKTHLIPKSPSKVIHNENFYINYSASPLSQIGKMKKEEQSACKEYGVYAEIDTNLNYDRDFDDVSCFLNSSPAYAFQQTTFGIDNELQGSYNDQFTNSSFLGENGLKIEETSAEYFSRTGLSSY